MNEEANDEIQLDFGAGNVAPLLSRCLRVAKIPTDCDICAQVCPTSAIILRELPQEKGALTSETPSQSESDAAAAGSAASTASSQLNTATTPTASDNDATPAESDAGSNPASNEDTAATTEAVKTAAQVTYEKKLGISVSEDCIHCGICASVCPLEAIATTKHHQKGFEKALRDKAARAEGVSMSCARSLFGVPSRFAEKAISLPCLGVLSAEEWFFAAALAREATLEALASDGSNTQEERVIGSLKVFLPPLICDGCPVNICGDAENAYLAAVSEAESWGADNIELIDEAEGLKDSPAGSLITTLNDVSSGDKREIVEQIADGFKRSWQSAGDDLTRLSSRAELLAKRRKQTKKAQSADFNAPRPFGKKSVRRKLLRDALAMYPTMVESVELVSVGTQAELCKGCGRCVYACPLSARRRVSSSSALYFTKLPEEKRPKGTQAAVTDRLCCLGCSACVQECPTGACTLDWLDGDDFYRLRLS